jgi:hypothetical protein
MQPQNGVTRIFEPQRATGDFVHQERCLAGARAADQERVPLRAKELLCLFLPWREL